ncbi:HAD family hydrolase [Candidatus Marinarcus aquaticus]|uniref:phosphoglycolate phosphatase n=1 Tax=Candidatus Marinarcus aquaticus TaxID=2044504 RepID=A0A4Q0XUE8_9BACT|nr:HAD family hydrolase [Candidatus Marinarcus aquaticus]RXJ60164.1 HAD family hydrolase [Candidatus Marinarcus aquaticus]
MKLIMFDMDGTLVNSGTMIANTINYVRENIGLEILEKHHILTNVNDPKINTAEFFYGTKHFTEEQTILFENYYNQNCLKELEIYDGIETLLKELKGEFKLAVATNASSIFAHKMLTHLGLREYFDLLYGYDSVSQPKPHPEMVYKIIEDIKTTKERSLLVGDSHKDTQAATSAGVDSILVNWGFSDHSENAIESVEELKQHIFKKFN